MSTTDTMKTQTAYNDEMLVEDMLYELDEIDAQVEELQALFTARTLSSPQRDWSDGALYEEDMYDLREEIGSFRDELENENKEHSWAMQKRSSLREKCVEHLRHVKRAFVELRKQFLFQY